jgi:hypothetical protein
MKLQFKIDDIHPNCATCKTLEENGDGIIAINNIHNHQHHDHATLECLNHELVHLLRQEQQVTDVIKGIESFKLIPKKKSPPTKTTKYKEETEVSETKIMNKFRKRFGIRQCSSIKAWNKKRIA